MQGFEPSPVGYLTTATTHYCIIQGAKSKAFQELAEFRGNIKTKQTTELKIFLS